jgi:hypothetical protein
MRVWRICIACWVPKDTTDTQNIYYVIPIYFPLQQCLIVQSYIILAFAPLVLVTINQNRKEALRHNGTLTYLTICWNEIQWKVRQSYKCVGLNCGHTCSAANFVNLATEAKFALWFITYWSTHSCILWDLCLHIHSRERIISIDFDFIYSIITVIGFSSYLFLLSRT